MQVDCYILSTTAFDCIESEGLLKNLSQVERDRSVQMISRRRKEYLLTRVLLRYIVSTRLKQISINDVSVMDRDGLPPDVPQARENHLHLAISHSHGRICIAASNQAAVGIDVEYLRGDRQFADVAQNCFSPSENSLLTSATTEVEMMRRYYLIWTRKEAWLKLHLMGIRSTSLQQIEFENGIQEQAGSIVKSRYFDDYCLSVAAGTEPTVICREVICKASEGLSILFADSDADWSCSSKL